MNKDFEQLTSACLFKCRCPACNQEVKDRLLAFLRGNQIRCDACDNRFVTAELDQSDAAKIAYLSDTLRSVFRIPAF